MKKVGIIILVSLLLNSCSEKQEFNDLEFKNMSTVSAELNENVILAHNVELNTSTVSGESKGMEFDEESGVLMFSVELSEAAGYEFAEMKIVNVDLDTTAILRRIISIDTIANKIQMQTEFVAVEEAFRNANFDLISEFDEDVNLKSGSTSDEIMNALVDGNKIKPAKIIYYTPNGVFVRSVFQNERLPTLPSQQKNEKYSKSISFNKSLDGYNIYNYSEDDKEIDLSITEGNIEFGTEFTMGMGIKWFKLKHFEFAVKPYAKTNAEIKFEASADYSITDEKKLVNDVFKVTYIFYVGIAIPVTFDIDIYAGYELNASAAVTATTGFDVGGSAEFSASYRDGWDFNREFDFHKTVDPFSYTLEGKVDVRLELFPRLTMKLYGIEGVSLDVVPYIDGDIDAGVINNNPYYNASLDFGLDARLGAKIRVLGKDLVGYNTGNLELIAPITLWEANGK